MTLDGWLVALVGLAFALGFLVGRKDSEQIDNKVINSNFWNGFEISELYARIVPSFPYHSPLPNFNVFAIL